DGRRERSSRRKRQDAAPAPLQRGRGGLTRDRGGLRRGMRGGNRACSRAGRGNRRRGELADRRRGRQARARTRPPGLRAVVAAPARRWVCTVRFLAPREPAAHVRGRARDDGHQLHEPGALLPGHPRDRRLAGRSRGKGRGRRVPVPGHHASRPRAARAVRPGRAGAPDAARASSRARRRARAHPHPGADLSLRGLPRRSGSGQARL
ncbi:MAG: hypothetical protein AVDCRST_MAG45-905, partial [uncultured Solirubrobacterales bacterium]